MISDEELEKIAKEIAYRYFAGKLNHEFPLRDDILEALRTVRDECQNLSLPSDLNAIAKALPCRGAPYEKCGDTEAGFYQCDVHWGAYQLVAALKANTKPAEKLEIPSEKEMFKACEEDMGDSEEWSQCYTWLRSQIEGKK